jgi:trimeric autotransporter adhesin
MGDSSDELLQLRPVTFLYKPEHDDGSHALQYGLIAEEVAKLYPEMVGYDKDGQPSGIKYQSLAPMLLNEVQKQAAQIQQQARQNPELEDRLTALETLLGAAPEAAR